MRIAMSTEENKALARRFCAALNTTLDGRAPDALTEQDLAAFDEVMTPDLAGTTKREVIRKSISVGAIITSRSRT